MAVSNGAFIWVVVWYGAGRSFRRRRICLGIGVKVKGVSCSIKHEQELEPSRPTIPPGSNTLV